MQTFPFKLEKANSRGPFNPFLRAGKPRRGDPTDTAVYTRNPGVHFYQPWLASDDKFNGPAFIWPLGVEAFNMSIEPSLGIHKFIGDNGVQVDVTHRGEERIVLTGNFPGNTGPDNMRALRTIVLMKTPRLGKVLYIPHALPYAQRVTVARARFGRTDNDRGLDMTYEVEFVRTGYVNAGKSDDEPVLADYTSPQPPGGLHKTKASTRSVQSDSKHNTVRKIAQWKLGNTSKWNQLYSKNEKWFRKRGIIAAKAPDYRLPVGTVIYY